MKWTADWRWITPALLLASGTMVALAVRLPPETPTSRETRASQASSLQKVEFPIRVEPTVELFSIIHRLAGTGQYDEVTLPEYVRDVWDHFGAFQDHPAVALAQEMSRSHSINGNAPMDLAVHVTPPPMLELRAPMELVLDDLDSRWSAEIIPPWLEAASAFARDTDFQSFFNAHESFYDQAVSSLRGTLAGTRMLPWFQEFYGSAPENYVQIIGLLNGTCDYGSRVTFPDGRMEAVSMVGAQDPDRDGIPQFSRSLFLPTIIHEFNHSYVNPMVDRNLEVLQPAGEALFPHLEETLARWGYNHWYVMVYEYLTRATTIRYLAAVEGPAAAELETNRDQEVGFWGVGELAGLLETYESDRSTHPDFESFLPRTVEFFQGMADYLERRGEQGDDRL